MTGIRYAQDLSNPMIFGGSSTALRCLNCKAEYLPTEVSYYCPGCELEGALDVVYDYVNLGKTFLQSVRSSARSDMWRYASLLPTRLNFAPPLYTGGSPLYLFRYDESGQVFIKDDSRNPSGSLKDRASALAVALAIQMGVKTIAAASTGNAAAALACMSAGSDIQCVIFAPRNASREKLTQIRAYGATVVEVDGGYDQAFAACHTACKENGWYNRSTGINAYMTEGKKTVAFEICEQLQWRVPDRIFVPVGNGCIVGSVYKGFQELMLMGITDRMPKIIGVQASGSNYLYRAWKAGTWPSTSIPTGLASSINVALPRDRIKALRAITATAGEFMTVDDDEILQGILSLARSAGVFAEPGAAAAYAGYKKWNRCGHERAVILITGSGLKDIGTLINSGILEEEMIVKRCVTSAWREL